MRIFLKRALTEPGSRYYFIVSDILAIVTIVSIGAIVLETVPSLQKYQPWFTFIEIISVTIFSIEYLARMYFTKPTRTYVLSFFGIIDLLAVVPTLFGLGNLTFLKSARTLRLIRLLRMVRLTKLAKHSGRDIEESLGFFGINIAIYVTSLLIALLSMGTLIYVVEGSQDAFHSIPLGMVWALKVFLTNIQVIEPLSLGGQIIHMMTMFVGLVLFGLLISAMGNVIQKYLFSKK